MLLVFSKCLFTICAASIPSWDTIIPNLTINSSGGLPPISETTYTIYNNTLSNGTSNPNGEYNNGPIPIIWNNLTFVSWYNAPESESQYMRVLFSVSKNNIDWSLPIQAFPNFTSTGEENEPWLLINNHLYCSASLYDYLDNKIPILRQILAIDDITLNNIANNHVADRSDQKFNLTPTTRHVRIQFNFGVNVNITMGDIFWLSDRLPIIPWLDKQINLTYLNMSNSVQKDMKQYLASLIDTETIPSGKYDDVFFNERSLYLMPNGNKRNKRNKVAIGSQKTSQDSQVQQLMLLLRTNSDNPRENAIPTLWASTCTNIIANNTDIVVSFDNLRICRPGIGVLRIGMVNILSDTGNVSVNNVTSSESAYTKCQWSKPVKTNIPDAPARTCVSSLSNNVIYYIGNAISKTREVLVLAISNDGYHFIKSWALKYNSNSQGNSFEYPSAVWNDDNLFVTYSLNKRDIQISVVSLQDIS